LKMKNTIKQVRERERERIEDNVAKWKMHIYIVNIVSL
jgi:hypothetical protein